jgi:hypothetical protein
VLELVVQDDPIDPRAALLQALGFAFEGSIDLDVMFELPLAFDARVKGLAALPVAITMALEQVPAVLRQRDGIVARAGDPSRLNQSLLPEMTNVARTRISRTIVVVSEITTGDHSKRSDGCERSRFRAAQGVLTIAVAYDLARMSARKVQIARERVTHIAVALRPARIVARVVSIAIRLSGVARTAAKVACSVIAIAAARLRQLQVVIAIDIIVRSTSAAAAV